MYSPVGHKNISHIVEKNKEWSLKHDKNGYLYNVFSFHNLKDLIVLPKFKMISFISEDGKSHNSLLKFKESEFIFDWNSYNILEHRHPKFLINFYYDDYSRQGYTWNVDKKN